MTGEERMLMEDQIESIRGKIHIQFPNIEWPEPVMEPVYSGRLKKTLIEGRLAVKDLNNGHFFDIVSDRYHLVTHEEVVHDMLTAVPTEFGKSNVDIFIYDNGARVRTNVTFPDLPASIGEIKEGDIVNPRISAYSSYNRSTHQGIALGGEQLICSNGLVAFMESVRNKRKHIIGSTITKEQLTEEIATFLTDFSKTTDLWRSWANRQLAKTELEEIVEALPFSETEQDKLLELPLMNNDGQFIKQLEKVTLWDVNSAATQYARHEVRGEQRAIDLEEQIARVIYNA